MSAHKLDALSTAEIETCVAVARGAVARLGFMLKPWGFFDRNPGLDVPPTEPGEGSCHA